MKIIILSMLFFALPFYSFASPCLLVQSTLFAKYRNGAVNQYKIASYYAEIYRRTQNQTAQSMATEYVKRASMLNSQAEKYSNKMKNCD